MECSRDVLVDNDREDVFHPKILSLDLEDLKSLESKATEALSLFGGLDIIVNNAGMSVRGGTLETEVSVYSRLMTVNYLGCVELSRHLVPHMISRGSGHVMVVSSVQGLLPVPGRAAYCGSKHALQAWADCLRAEVCQSGVKVSVVSPGYVNTDLSKHALTATGKRQAGGSWSKYPLDVLLGQFYGVKDANQERGYSVEYVAEKIIQYLLCGNQQLILAPLYVRLAVLLRAFLPTIYFIIMSRRVKN